MATVNKASLRTEFDALKARFESLCAAGKMSAKSPPVRRSAYTESKSQLWAMISPGSERRSGGVLLLARQ